MEELRKLEEAQGMLSFMEESGFNSSPDSNPNARRFLANFILFLMQPCGELDMESKCTLIRDNLPKISTNFLKEASVVFNQQRPSSTERSAIAEHSRVERVHSNGTVRKDYCFPDLNFVDSAVIGLDAMERANSTLQDFCRSYLMFHGMDVNKPQSVFKFLPVLAFTESYIYQMDSLNEKIVDVSSGWGGAQKRGYEKQLQCRGLMTGRIKEELEYGKEYWTLERKLCSELVNRKQISTQEVMRAIDLKSFDFRVLNLLLYELRGEKVDDLHMEFLSISEFLVEVSDDLMMY